MILVHTSFTLDFINTILPGDTAYLKISGKYFVNKVSPVRTGAVDSAKNSLTIK